MTNGLLILAISALAYLILSAMLMDLLMELIAHALQSRASSELKDDPNNLHPISPQDEQAQEIPSARVPNTQQNDSPRPPPVCGPPGPVPMSVWLFPPSDYVRGVIAVTRFQRPAIRPVRPGSFL